MLDLLTSEWVSSGNAMQTSACKPILLSSLLAQQSSLGCDFPLLKRTFTFGWKKPVKPHKVTLYQH